MPKGKGYGKKPGSEGLPYKSAESVCGGPVDQPQSGLQPGKGVDGSQSVKPPKGQ